MPKRALIAFATFALVATACISSVTPAVNYGTGARFVPFVVDSLDDMGRGDAVALTVDGIPYVSYFGFAEKLEKGDVAIPRPFGSPTVPGVMLATSSTDGLWQRGAIEMAAPPPLLDPQGVAVPFGPVQTDVDLTAANTNGTAMLVDSSGTVDMAWTGGSQVSYGTSKLGGTATVDRVFDLGRKVTQAGPISRPSIVLDGDGNPWISFAVETSKGIEIHAAHQEGNTWADAVVATAASCGGCPSPQPTGIGLVGSSLVVLYADHAANEVHAATLTRTSWTDTSVASGVSGFGLSFSVVGDSAYAAYYTGNGTVDEATWKSGSWNTTTVSDAEDPDTTVSGDLASNTAVTATDDGTVYVAWEDDGVHLSTGTDSFQAVDIGNTVRTGADPALSASSGGVVLSWYDTSGQNQMIGYLSDLTDVVVARPSPSLTTASQAPGGAKECGNDVKVALDETAQGTAFQQPCLVAAAGAAFTINFDNQDSGLQHNIAIFTDDTATDNLFRGDVITGVDTTTYDVKPLDAGSYFFHCDIHPTMTGTLAVVKGAK